MENNKKVKIIKNGPYSITGNIPLHKEIAVVGDSHEPERWEKGKEYPVPAEYLLCRCGHSKNMPFCDQSHKTSKFNGTETASREKYLKMAEKLAGPELDMTDVPELCSSARFCHLAGGTWNNVVNSDDPVSKKFAIQTACDCPAGRLVVWDKKTGQPIEPEFSPSIGVTEDPQEKVSGPLWLKGGIELESADGMVYEKRNRMTLCRCGQSTNKPFCDGSHISAGFNDGDASLK